MSLPSYLRAPLEVGTGNGLPTTDRRFAQVARLAEAGEHHQAAQLAETILEEGVLDIRLMKHGIFSRFLSEGLEGLGPLLGGLYSVLEASSERVGPRNRWDVHLQKSLGWLFDQMEQSIRYHRNRRDSTWLTLNAPPDAIDQAVANLETIVDRMPILHQPGVDEARSRLRRLLVEIRAEGQATEPRAPEGQSRMQQNSEKPPTMNRKISAGEIVKFEAVPPLRNLMEKLAAFETLARKGDFRKAALVADDIQSAVDDFDPRLYFPSLFTNFGQLLSDHVDSIAPYWAQKDSVSWKMLEQFYRVDLSSFVGEDGREDI